MGGNEEVTSPSRRRLLDRQPDVLIPVTGAGKYWYVDPRALQQAPQQNRPLNPADPFSIDQPFNPQGYSAHEDQGDAIMNALQRLLETSQQYQPKAQEGTFGF
jgi:hypothetical protein